MKIAGIRAEVKDYSRCGEERTRLEKYWKKRGEERRVAREDDRRQ